jgi:hypothetical protein
VTPEIASVSFGSHKLLMWGMQSVTASLKVTHDVWHCRLISFFIVIKFFNKFIVIFRHISINHAILVIRPNKNFIFYLQYKFDRVWVWFNTCWHLGALCHSLHSRSQIFSYHSLMRNQYTWLKLMKNKTEARTHLIDFIALIETHFIKWLKSLEVMMVSSLSCLLFSKLKASFTKHHVLRHPKKMVLLKEHINTFST